ncbi:class I SAM-dependent DNA methyltransferase [Paludibaculum fermentans]|uniref:class I SAM-dependent DNA methyltransferase n=1 Tax=Paludibaculum fermentans TaxID=1473598 RepID=UPI003EBA9A82
MASDTYRWLARYYDHLFEFRRQFDTARESVIGPVLPGVKAACDLCCGTGTLALELAAQGIEMYAVDLSPDMCRIARKKVRGTGLPVHVIQADMRTFVLPRQVDLVTCEFDALNHVPQKRDLGRVLRGVARALRPGGHFAFDVNNRRAFERVWSNTWFLEKDPIAMIMHGGHRRGSDRAWSDVEWFIRVGEKWTRHHEHIEEVCWSAPEIRTALAAAGFDQVKAWDAAPFFEDALTPAGNRTFWRARLKPVAKASA